MAQRSLKVVKCRSTSGVPKNEGQQPAIGFGRAVGLQRRAKWHFFFKVRLMMWENMKIKRALTKYQSTNYFFFFVTCYSGVISAIWLK